eukprot:15834157-Heterocapsa_arctica.AAC.1
MDAVRRHVEFNVLMVQEFADNQGVVEGEIGGCRYYSPPRGDRFRSTAIFVTNTMLQQFDSDEFKGLGSTAMLEARVGDNRMVFISGWAPHGEL